MTVKFCSVLEKADNRDNLKATFLSTFGSGLQKSGDRIPHDNWWGEEIRDRY